MVSVDAARSGYVCDVDPLALGHVVVEAPRDFVHFRNLARLALFVLARPAPELSIHVAFVAAELGETGASAPPRRSGLGARRAVLSFSRYSEGKRDLKAR